jgi:hypothetical protein
VSPKIIPSTPLIEILINMSTLVSTLNRGWEDMLVEPTSSFSDSSLSLGLSLALEKF